MQKAKKMSKQTLVIAVLAVLLVLSLALSVTGAWFTDTDSKASATDIQFGTVKLGATTLTEKHTLSGSRNTTQVLPGDTFTLEGGVATDATGGSTVKIYVAVYLTNVKVMGTATADVSSVKGVDDAGYDADAEAAVFNINLKDICGEHITVTNLAVKGTPTNATVLADHGVDGLLIYTVEANKAASIALEGSVKFEKAFTNNYTKDGKTYVMNDNGEIAAGANTVVVKNVRISASMKVAAVQFDNISQSEAINQLKTDVGYVAA